MSDEDDIRSKFNLGAHVRIATDVRVKVGPIIGQGQSNQPKGFSKTIDRWVKASGLKPKGRRRRQDTTIPMPKNGDGRGSLTRQ